MTLTQTSPDVKQDERRPLAISNKGFPYNNLPDHRRFEELVYLLYRQEINGGSWKNKFEGISLLQGVRERGRDCVLYNNGKIAGVIQCKHSVHSSERATRPDCVKEILKFVLHAIIDKSLIPDPKSFTYFFAISHGFAEPALALLDNFSAEIQKENELGRLISNIISANAGLSSLAGTDTTIELLSVLTTIKVEKILPQDLDDLLMGSASSNIVPLFFEVRTVIRPDDVRPIIREELEYSNRYQDVSNLPFEKILEKFDHASFHLTSYNDQFEGIPNSNIKRSEAQQLLSWVLNPIKEVDDRMESDLPIVLLAGNAGAGKTVVLKELLTELRVRGIPVLGLKADRLYAKSIRELEEKISLEDSIYKLMRRLKQNFDKVVVLIDQIDALSQSVSINTEYIDTFNHLVRELVSIEGVRVVISCRVYDLNFDSELKFYKNQRIINLSLLDKEDVNRILRFLDVTARESLLELLRTPHNLNVFCKTHSRNNNIENTRSLNDLYNELWRQKVVRVPQGSNLAMSRCKELLYSMADGMYSSQRIVAGRAPFVDNYFQELEYLKSNGLVLEDGRELQFFHQTFYEFVFSKSFVDSKKTLSKYLTENHQALHIRSSVKMILNFLRDSDPQEYVRVYNQILFSDKWLARIHWNHYRIHIKLLFIEVLGFQSEISADEADLAKKIMADQRYRLVFFDSIASAAWLKFCVENQSLNKLLCKSAHLLDRILLLGYVKGNGVVTKLLKSFSNYEFRQRRKRDDISLCFQVLRRQLPVDRGLVLDFLSNSPEFENKPHFVIQLLYFLKIWDGKTSYDLFDRYHLTAEIDKHSFYHILEDAAKYDISWAINRYRTGANEKIQKITGPSFNSEFEYNDEHFFKVLFDKDRVIAFEFAVEIVETISKAASSPIDEPNDIVRADLAFLMFDYERANHSHEHGAIFRMLISAAEELAKEQADVFNRFAQSYANSNSQTMLMPLLYGLIANPAAYFGESFTLIRTFAHKKVFEREGKLQFLVRRLLGVAYIYFDYRQKAFVNDHILRLHSPRETSIYEREGKKMHNLRFYGFRKFIYLKALPWPEIESNALLKKICQELKRKFPDAQDEDPKKTYGGVVGPPLGQATYRNMDLGNWEKSFRKYHSEFRIEFHSLKGSLQEHARAFESEVVKRPNFFFPLIEQLIDDRTITTDYVIHGLQGLKSAKYNPLEVKRLFKRLIKYDFDRDNTRYITWLTDYFIDTHTLDGDIVHYLCEKAVNHTDPENDRVVNGVLMDGINTVRGGAASRIPYLQVPELRDLIFETVDKIIHDKSVMVRVAIMPRFALLMNLDEERTLMLFLKATENPSPEIFEQTPWTASYLAHKYFSRLISYFEAARKMESMHDDMAAILGVAWVKGKKYSSRLLSQALKSSIKAKAKMVDLCINFLLDEDDKARQKARSLYVRFLNNVDKDIVHEYSTSFLHLSRSDFQKLLPLLRAYSKSAVAKESPHYFFEYLLECAKRHPKECIDLLASANKYHKPDITEGGYYDDEPLKVLLGAYNALRTSNQLSSAYMKKSMRLFDKMLLDERFRKSAQKALVEVES
jgi:uridine kinase